MTHPGKSGATPAEGARLRVLDAVRRGARTVNAIAATLGVTDNAVRGHLAALERDGLIDGSGVVRSGHPGKPALEYELPMEAEVALSRAYAPALDALVGALGRRLDPRTLRAALADAGRQLAQGPAHSRSTVAERTAGAAELIESLGGSVSTSVQGRHGEVTGNGCPLAAVVAHSPDTCMLVREMLANGVGGSVEMHCAHGPRPRCAFRIS